MYNKTGGAYLYAREAFGPFAGVFGGLDDVAFVYHWLGLGRKRFWALFRLFLPTGNGWLSKMIITVLIVGLSAINFFGVKPGARAINFFTVGKLLSLLIFISVGFFLYMVTISPHPL